MADDAEQCAEILACCAPAEKIAQEIIAQQHRADSLEHVERDDHGRALRAVIAVKIRQPRVVAAAMAAHVVMVENVRRRDRAVDAAQKIRQHRNGDRCAIQHYCCERSDLIRINSHQSSLSPFSRMDMMTGVPSSPKTLRMQFSR